MSKYTTVQGDMWDNIAYSQLGDVKYTDTIMRANPAYREVYSFSAGIVLDIPEIDTTSVNDNLPPWKKVSG